MVYAFLLSCHFTLRGYVTSQFSDLQIYLLFIFLLGGFATYIISMTSVVAKSLTDDPDPREIVDHVPIGQWMLFIFLVCTVGILSIQPFKEVILLPL